MNWIRPAAAAALCGALLAAPVLAAAATPQAGVQQRIRRGFYTETDLGTFFDFRTSPVAVSNAQAYLQLGVGYDLTEHMSVGFEYGLGASAQLCFAGTDPSASPCQMIDGNGTPVIDKTTGLPQTVSDNFSNSFFQAHFTYYIPLAERLVLAPRLVGGYATLDPAPLVNSNTGKQIAGGPMAGLDLGIEYATHMDHFTVGLDVLSRFIIGPNIPSMAIFPRVKYTF